MNSNEDFEFGGLGCVLIAVLVALVIGICVWKYHYPTPPRKRAENVTQRLVCSVSSSPWNPTTR